MLVIGISSILVVVDAHQHIDDHAGTRATASSDAIVVTSDAITLIFVAEAALKVSALGARRYVQDQWNVFDASVAAICLVETLLRMLLPPNLMRALRLVRLLRLLRFLKTLPGLHRILKTLMFSLPALFNIMGVFLLIQYIYAVLAVTLFGQENAQFCNFPSAFLALIVASTGDDWNSMMHATMRSGSRWAVPFFVSHIVLTSLVVLQVIACP